MPFNHELNDRQSARIIEQAIRAGTPMRVEPHHTSGSEVLTVELIDAKDDRLTFLLPPDQALMAEKFLPGQYCQIQFAINGGVYSVSVHIVAIETPGTPSAGNNAPRHLVTSRPNVVQILERRKFVRTQLANRTVVMVRWPEDDRVAEASLFNIGGGGLAFRIDKDFGDRIHIGDRMEATFELPGLPRRFTFSLSMCNKTVGADNTSVIVGAQFVEGSEVGQAGPLDELRRFLATQQQPTLSRQ